MLRICCRSTAVKIEPQEVRAWVRYFFVLDLQQSAWHEKGGFGFSPSLLLELESPDCSRPALTCSSVTGRRALTRDQESSHLCD